MKKKLFSFLTLAVLLAAVGCRKEKPVVEDPVFPETEWTGVVADGVPFSFTVSPTPNYDWTVSIPEQEYFSLSDETTPRYSVSGMANSEASVTVYATAVVPESIQTCDVVLTMKEVSKKIATVTRMGAESANFEIHVAVPVSDYDGELFEKDAEGNYVYADAAVTAFDLIADDEGEKNYQQRFQVISEKDWDITQAPVWMAIYDRSGNEGVSGEAGVVERFAVADDELRPFEASTEQLVFTEKTDASNAAVLATVDVTVPGCGDFISASWAETALFNASGEFYNENSGGFTSYSAVVVRAPYGSEVFFASVGGWIGFAQELAWQKEDWNGNDLTVRGIQMLVGEVSCDFNGDEPRTAYLIGIPVNQVKAGYTADKALNADGTVAKGYEQFVLCTITQIAAAPSDANALVKWAWSDDEIGEYDRDDFATLETIRPADGQDERTQFFAKDWATAPVAYAVHYKNLEAFSVAGLIVPEHASVEVYGPEGPWAEAPLSPEWALWDATTPVIAIDYDFGADKWNTAVPDDFTAFFVFKDKDGKVITWILFTLDPVHFVPGDPKELISGPSCDKGSAALFNLNAGEPGYDSNYSGIPQYKLEMINTTSVSFETVPAGRVQVWGEKDGAEHSEWFQRMGTSNSFVVETEQEDAAMTFYVVFLNGTGAPVAVLYVDYLYGNPTLPAAGFGGATAISNSGTEQGSATLTELKEGDHGYDPDTTGPQYLLEVSGANFVQFETFPEGIDDIWSDGDEVEYQAGILSFFPKGDEAEFDVIFKKNYASVGLMHVHYTGEGEQGGDKPAAAFVLDASSISNGATVRLTTPEDEWYTAYAGDAEQWTLIVNREDPKDDGVIFLSFPSVEDEPMVIGDHNYFELNPQGNNMTVMLLGDAWGVVESAEYNVFFYDPQWHEVAYRLHVRFNMDAAPGPGGNEPAGELIALAEGNAEGVSLRKTAETDSWFMNTIDYDQWTLTVNGASDLVMFSAVPNLDGLLVLEDQDNEKGYFEVEKQGASWIVYLAGSDYDAGKAVYTVVFYDPQWSEPYCRLHVEWSK